MSPATATERGEIIPILDEGLGNQSYVVALGDGRALVVDPSRDPMPYLQVAEQRGLQITHTAETHLHADFISGSRELAARGATILAPKAAELQMIYRGLNDGDEVDLGSGWRLRALATPGHTPEHRAYLLLDGDRPIGLFSGGALIPGGAARTDLIAPEQTEPLARALFRSVREHLAGLPDDLVVYPTHGSGSFCSTGPGGDRTTTLEWERRINPLLTADDEDAFVRGLLAGYGTYPAYFLRLRSINQRGARLFGPTPPDLRRLSLEEFRRELAAGAMLVDTRPYQEFAGGHVPGALSIALRPAFASWLGWLVPADRPLLFLMGRDQDRRNLVTQCLKIGYEDLRGELAGGIMAWRAADLPLASTELRHAGDDLGPNVLDVRQDSEWQSGHVPSARHIELGSVRDGGGRVPPDPLTVYCGHGERAMTAASMLEAQGHRNLAVLDGGFEAWSAAGQPVTAG